MKECQGGDGEWSKDQERGRLGCWKPHGLNCHAGHVSWETAWELEKKISAELQVVLSNWRGG